MSYNLDIAVGGYSVLVPATTMALGSTGGVAAGFNITSTGTAQLNFNGLVKALAATTNQVATFVPAVQTSTYQQQILPKNLGPSQQCSIVILADDAATPNLYWAQGQVVDSSQASCPIPGPQGVISTSSTDPFDLPVQITELVPLLYVKIATTAAQAYQFPGGAALPTLTGVTNYQYTYASLTAPTQFVVCNWLGTPL
jgi:hypothetical protein